MGRSVLRKNYRPAFGDTWFQETLNIVSVIEQWKQSSLLSLVAEDLKVLLALRGGPLVEADVDVNI